ncbi:integrase, partial [Mesorhizobium sp. M7A.F.Ca.US.001.04.2.1]
MASVVDQNPENRTRHRSARPQETARGVDQIAQAGSAGHDTPIAHDLPDIIDVVMEMGRTPEEPPAKAPSPLPAVANPRLPAHLDALADRARDYVEAASSANTRRAYAADWKHFCAWA